MFQHHCYPSTLKPSSFRAGVVCCGGIRTLCLQPSSLHSPVLIVAVVHVKGDHSEALANQSCVEPSPSRDKNRTTVWYTCVVTFTTTFLIYYITEQQRYIHSKEVHVFTIRGRHTSMPFLICGCACMHLPTS